MRHGGGIDGPLSVPSVAARRFRPYLPGFTSGCGVAIGRVPLASAGAAIDGCSQPQRSLSMRWTRPRRDGRNRGARRRLNAEEYMPMFRQDCCRRGAWCPPRGRLRIDERYQPFSAKRRVTPWQRSHLELSSYLSMRLPAERGVSGIGRIW